MDTMNLYPKPKGRLFRSPPRYQSPVLIGPNSRYYTDVSVTTLSRNKTAQRNAAGQMRMVV